jgi:hypothetical protein
MELRFWNDAETGLPHIFDHNVTEEEVRQVLRRAGEELPGSDCSRIRLGQTEAGRYLQVQMIKKKKQKYPVGWDEERVRKLAEHYDNQTEDEQVAEHEAAMQAEDQTVMVVPTELVPEIIKLINKKRPA